MERLPNRDLDIIEEQKITRYLLASDHPAGWAKATFFFRFGFQADAGRTLRDALLRHARSGRVAAANETRFGKKFILEGRLTTPDGRRPVIRSVWFIRVGEVAPRFVTAYPLPGVAQ